MHLKFQSVRFTPIQSMFTLAFLLAASVIAGCSSGPPEHGTAFLLEVDIQKLASPVERDGSLADVMASLRKRLDRFGSHFSIETNGADRILVKVGTSVPGEIESLKRTLLRSGRLEFRLVHADNDQLLTQGTLLSGYEILKLQGTGGGHARSESFVVKKTPEQLGGGIKSAMVNRDPLGQAQIAFQLDTAATAAFGSLTRSNIGHRLAIILDGQIYSAPVIRSAIEAGSGVISGQFTPEEAFELAGILEFPFVPPVKLLETKSF